MTHTETPPTGVPANASRRSAKSRHTRRRWLVLGALTLGIICAYAAYRYPRGPIYGDGKAHVVIAETLICEILPGYVDYSEVFSNDHTRCAYVVERSGKKVVVVDGVEGPLFDEAGEWEEPSSSSANPGCVEAAMYDIQFSDDSGHVAYIAKRDGKYCVVYDGVPGPFYDGVGVSFGGGGNLQEQYYKQGVCLSDDSRHWAYPAIKGDQQVMVIDGLEGPPFDEVSARVWTMWSPDGKHTAYSARVGDKWFVVHDGSESAAYDEVQPDWLEFGEDSAHFAYYARAGGKWRYVVDGVEGKWYDEVNDFHFGRDGGAAYVASERGRSFIVSNGVEGPRHHSVRLFEVDDAGGPALYRAQDGLRTFVMDHGTLRPGYNGVSEVYVYGWPESWTASIYKAHKGKKSCIVVDGVEGKWYDRTGRVYVSPDGKRFAYDAQVSEERMCVVDGVEYSAMANISFSPDSRHFIGDARYSNESLSDLAESFDDWFGIQIPTPTGRRWDTVELDGKTIGTHERLGGLSFTVDGRHIFYAASQDGEDFIFIDGQKASEAIDVNSLDHLRSDGDSLAWVTRKDNAFRRVKATIVSD